MSAIVRIFIKLKQCQRENAQLERTREDWILLSPSEICAKYYIQNCHVCERDDCCDNINPAIQTRSVRIKELETCLGQVLEVLPALDWSGLAGISKTPFIKHVREVLESLGRKL